MKVNFYYLYILQVVLCFKLDIKTASEILKRTRRENSGESYNGEFNGDNFERECVEERCDSEEFDEIFDMESGIVKYFTTPVKVSEELNVERELAAACKSRADADKNINITNERRAVFIRQCMEQRDSSFQVQAYNSPVGLDSIYTTIPTSTITVNTYDPTTIWDTNTARTNSNEYMPNSFAGPK